MSRFSSTTPHVLVLGGGSVGVSAATTLRKELGSKVAISVVDKRPYQTFYPLLPEVGAGQIAPSDVLPSHRKLLRGCKLITGGVSEIRTADKTVVVETESGELLDVSYDYLVVGLGSVPRLLPIPGLAENAIGFKWVEEAQAVRDRILDNLSEAATVKDPAQRKRLLTFTFVGGGFAGGEALAEVEDMVRSALKYYPDLHSSDVRFVLIEALGRILPEVGENLGKWSLKHLRERGIEIKLETFMNSCTDGHVVCSDGDEFDTDLIVWTAGIKPNPVLENSDIPLNKTGRIDCLADLRVKGENGDPIPGVFAAGDCTTVPDLAAGEGKVCPPNAQHATRQGKRLAKNIVADIEGRPVEDYFHRTLGTMATLGMYKGVALIPFRGKDIELKGLPAWLMARGYHAYALPSRPKQISVVVRWIVSALGGRDFVGIEDTARPRAAFEEASKSVPAKK